MPEDIPSLDELSELLRRCLTRINANLENMSGSDKPEDMEPLLTKLDEETARIQGLMLCIGGLLDSPRLSHPEIDELVRRASDDVLSELDTPLVLRTNTAKALPVIAVAEDSLFAALRRAIVIGASHAGPGGDLTVTTTAGPKTVVFHVVATPRAGRSSANSRERCATLEEFLADLGGCCTAEVDRGGVMRLRLELAASIEHA